MIYSCTTKPYHKSSLFFWTYFERYHGAMILFLQTIIVVYYGSRHREVFSKDYVMNDIVLIALLAFSGIFDGDGSGIRLAAPPAYQIMAVAYVHVLKVDVLSFQKYKQQICVFGFEILGAELRVIVFIRDNV